MLFSSFQESLHLYFAHPKPGYDIVNRRTSADLNLENSHLSRARKELLTVYIERKEKEMKTKSLMTAVLVLMLAWGSAFAQMGGGGMGPGGGHMGPGPMPGPGPGPNPGPNPGPMPGPGPGMGHTGGGMGYGMMGAGGMMSGMMPNTLEFGYLDVLDQITSSAEAIVAIKDFLSASNTSLKIAELWEYGTVYKAELIDTTGARAFDLVADKLTGAVAPEMGMSMMLNASYGKGMYKTTIFPKNLTVTVSQATQNAEDFLSKNPGPLPYNLVEPPETYPGYYKFHTTDKQNGKPGMDIMVNGYNGEIWMNTYLGLPLNSPITSGF